MHDLLVQDCDWIITLDRERRMLRGGSILVRNGQIVAVGRVPAGEIPAGIPVLDGRGKMALPGLVEGHVHNALHLGRGVADEANFKESFTERYYPYEKALTAEDAYVGAQLCQLEMIKSGVSCFIDPGSDYPEAAARVAVETGLRGIVARSMFDLKTSSLGGTPPVTGEDTLSMLAEAEALHRKWHGAGDGRVGVWLELRPPRNCSDTLIREAVALAERLGVGVQAHCSSAPASVEASRQMWGTSDILRLAGLGALGPRLLLIHMGVVSDEELDLLARFDVKVAHCPSASLHGAYGAVLNGRFPEMLDRGITVCLGSDASGSGNFIDIVRVMYLAACGHKEAHMDASVMPPERALEMATLGGARTAGWDRAIGSLEPGKRGDIALFDCWQPGMVPLINPVANLVYSGHGGYADSLVVDGRILMAGGKVLTLDERAVVRAAQSAGVLLLRRAGLEKVLAPAWPVVESGGH